MRLTQNILSIPCIPIPALRLYLSNSVGLPVKFPLPPSRPAGGGSLPIPALGFKI